MRRRSAPHLGAGDRRTRAAVAVRHRAPPRRAVRRLRRAPPGAAAATGPRRRPRLGRRPELAAASCGGGCGSGSASPAGRAAGTRPAPRCAPTRAGPRCPAGCRCSARPGCRPRTSPCWPRWPSTARCTSGCRTPPPRCGMRWPPAPPGRSRRAADRPDGRGRPAPAAVLARPRRPRAAAAAGRRGAARRAPAPPACPIRRRTLLGRLQRRLRDDRPPAAARRSPTATAACRCTPATARTGRSRCCARWSSGCWPTTPRSSRATCWSCARTSRRSRRWSRPRSGSARAGPPTSHPGQRLQVRLADRALRQVNPLLDTVAQLLELADARVTAAQAARPAGLRAGAAAVPARRRRPGAAARPGRRAPGVRWGLDAAHRAPLPAGRAPRRTPGRPGSTGCCSGSRCRRGRRGRGPTGWAPRCRWTRSTPATSTLVGRLAEFVDRLAAVLGRARRRAAAGRLGRGPRPRRSTCSPTPPHADAWQAAQARAELAEAGPRGRAARRHRRRSGWPTCARCSPSGCAAGPPGPTSAPARSPWPPWCRCARCRTGWSACSASTTACSRGPAVPDGDDLLARDPLVGERDPRSEDRQLLLDAICAATEHLVVVHSGADERTGARRPARGAAGRAARRRSRPRPAPAAGTQVHRAPPAAALRRRATSPPGALGRRPGRSASTAPSWPGRWRPPGRSGRAGPVPAGAAGPARPATTVVALDDLVALPRAPGQGVPAAAGRAAGVGAATSRPGRRAAGRARRAGHAGRSATGCCATGWPATTADRCRQAEWRRGELPPGALGDALLTGSLDDVEPLVAAAGRCRRPSRCRTGDVDVALPDGARLVGTVGGLYRGATGRPCCGWSTPGSAPKQRLRAWVRLLALAAADPASRGGRSPSAAAARHGLAQATARPVDAGRGARRLLADLVALCDAGLREPLPLPTGRRRTPTRGPAPGGADAAAAAEEAMRKWTAGGAGAERADDAHRQVWGPAAGPEVLLGRGPARPAASPPGSARSRCGCGRRCCWPRTWCGCDGRERPVDAADRLAGTRSTCAARCPPAPPCWRPAPAPARPSPSPRWPPATSPRAGPQLSELMLVTFGRAATRSCASGCASGWSAAERGLADPAAARAGDRRGARPCSPTPTDAEVARRRGPAGRARSPTSTRPPSPPPTSSASRCWPGSGVAGDADPDARVRRGHRRPGHRGGRRPLRAQVRATAAPARPAFSRADGARRSARRAVHDGQARLEPADAEPGSTADVRRRFAAAVRAEVDRRKRRRPARHLRRPAHPAARRAGRPAPRRGARAAAARYRVVLVDEFQDTDPVQWEILRRAFHGHDHAGPDRRPEAGDLRLPRRRRRQLPGRRRRPPTGTPRWHATGAATPPLLAALDAVFGGAALGDPRIVVRPVERRAPRPAAARRPGATRRCGCGCCAAAELPRTRSGTSPCRPGPRRWSPPTSPPTSPALLGQPGATVGGRPGAARATSRCWCAPTTRARWCATRWPRPACRRCCRHGQRLRHPAARGLADAAGGAGAAAPRRPGCGPRR